MKEKISRTYTYVTGEHWQKILRAIDENWPRSKLLNYDEMIEADNWCKENCQGPYIIAACTIYVKEERDAIMFLLRWS